MIIEIWFGDWELTSGDWNIGIENLGLGLGLWIGIGNWSWNTGFGVIIVV